MHIPVLRGPLHLWLCHGGLTLSCHAGTFTKRQLFPKVTLLLLISSFCDVKHRMLNEYCRSKKSTAWEEEYTSVNISSCSQGPAIKLSISWARHAVQSQHYSKPTVHLEGFSPAWLDERSCDKFGQKLKYYLSELKCLIFRACMSHSASFLFQSHLSCFHETSCYSKLITQYFL